MPAGYVFSIWGLIYLLLIGYTAYHSLPAQRTNALMRRTAYFYAISCVANSTWIFLWHYAFLALTVVVMFTLLLLFILFYQRVAISKSRGIEQWLVQLPSSVYLGWITVATLANVTIYLEYVSWNAFGIGAQAWAVVLLVAATGHGLLFGLRYFDWAYLLVLVWAFAGIAVKQSDAPLVIGAASGMAVVLAVVMGVVWIRQGLALQPVLSGGSS